MSDTFWWGALGGSMGYVVGFLLPWVKDVRAENRVLRLSVGRVALELLLIATDMAMGGVAALTLGDVTTAKQAIIYGVGGEVVLAGLLRTRARRTKA